MAFIKLFPAENQPWHSLEEVSERLTLEFDYVDIDRDAGRKYVGRMIAATRRLADSLPGKQERLRLFGAFQDASAYVVFGDDTLTTAAFCYMPDSEVFFGSPDEVHGPQRALVERAARVLGYSVYEG
jgi:hypothetical protein